MKVLEEQALEDESGYQEDEVIHIHFYEPGQSIKFESWCIVFKYYMFQNAFNENI